MALVHINATVGTTITKIFTIPAGIKNSVAVQLQNLDTAAVFVGDASVTTSGATRGHSIAANATFQFWLSAGDTVWAISAAGTTAGALVVTYSGV
jgi:D-arabinose 5-phosphate isomerase GutQ